MAWGYWKPCCTRLPVLLQAGSEVSREKIIICHTQASTDNKRHVFCLFSGMACFPHRSSPMCLTSI